MQGDLSKGHTGGLGEELACRHLTQNGYQIIKRNFRTPIGEIDIIAKKEKILHFFEVKTRRGNNWGDPLEAITTRKKAKIRRVAQWFLTKYRESLPCLFGAIGVDLSTDPASIDCVIDAFE